MTQQTAVEYLFHQLWDTPKDKLNWYAILKEAKQMEKEQIMDAWWHGFADANDFPSKTTAKQYYNETYNK